MLYILISYLFGLIISLNFKVKLSICIISITSLILIYIGLNYNSRKGRFIKIKKEVNFSHIFVLIFIIIFSFLYTKERIKLYDNKYKSGNISGEFKILSIEKDSDYYNKFYCKNDLKDKFILQVKKTINVNLEVNDEIYLEGEYKLPNLVRNQGGFNYRRYLNSKNLYGTIIVEKNTIELKKKGKLNIINEIRKNIEKTFSNLLPSDYAGVINGMLNGDTKNISEETLKNFKNSGITHLLAVSGSNIAYIIMLLSLSSNKIFGKYLSYYVIIISITIFIFVSGASASVARAGIMAILNIVAILFSRKSNTINNICFSALILLIINPLTIYDVGFLLSFGGTLGIVLISKKINEFIKKYIKVNFISETIGITISAQIMILPILIYYFNTVSILSIFTNILVVPISGFLTILGFITVIIGQFSLGLAKVVAYAVYALISFMFVIAKFFGNISWSNVLIPTPKICWIIIYYMLIFLNIKKVKYKKYFLRIIGLFSIICLILTQIPRNYINLNMIDVGQGDSVYIETSNKKVILIDGGGSEKGDYDVGENIVVPYLLDKGKAKVDLIIISHPHEDHIEGVFTVIEKLKVSKVIISKNIEEESLIKELKALCNSRGTEIIEVCAGDIFEIDNVKFEVLYPSLKDKDLNLNNMSLVIKMKYGNKTALFTGDLEATKEKEINYNLKADILKVGHHGSITSTSEAFLRNVNPNIALISVGENNSYGHPDKVVLDRLHKINAKIYRTDKIGEVKLKIMKNKIEKD